MAGNASIDPVDGGEVDVLVQAGDHHLLDLEVGLDEVRERGVQNEVVEPLLESGDSLVEAVEAATQRVQAILGVAQRRESDLEIAIDL